MPDFFKESYFGRQYSVALHYYNFAQENIKNFEFIKVLPQEAESFVKKGIDDFERYYEFGLNKNYVKKLKVVLTNSGFWFCFVLASLYPIYAFWYKKSVFYYTIGLFGIFIASSIIFFRYLCPCQLEYFWEERVLKNSVASKTCVKKEIWLLTHPLHRPRNREQVINAYKTQLQVMFFTVMQLKQSALTYTICPSPIFLKSFSSMNLYFDDPILIFSPAEIRQKIEQIESLFSKTQRFKKMFCSYNDAKKLIYYYIDGIKCDRDSDTQTDTDYFQNNVLRSIGKSLHAVVYIRRLSESRENSEFNEQFDASAFQIAYAKKAHLIHFENSHSSIDACSASFVLKNHSLLDGSINTAL